MLDSILKAAIYASAAMLWLSPATPATLIPVVQAAGASSTTAYAINDDNIIAGSFIDNTGTHAFFGTIAGSYTAFDYKGPGVFKTEARGINDSGYITGYAASTKRILGYEWERDPAGNLTTITRSKNDIPLDGIAQQINNAGLFVGDWIAEKPPNNRSAYEGKNGELSKTLDLPFGSSSNAARGVNNAGEAVGYFLDNFGSARGFVLSDGAATQVDYPDRREVTTYLAAINDKGLATGYWGDKNNALHAFKLDTVTNAFTPIRVPGKPTVVQAWGVNKAGLIALSSFAGNFIYCPRKPAKCPHANSAIEIADAPGARN